MGPGGCPGAAACGALPPAFRSTRCPCRKFTVPIAGWRPAGGGERGGDRGVSRSDVGVGGPVLPALPIPSWETARPAASSPAWCGAFRAGAPEGGGGHGGDHARVARADRGGVGGGPGEVRRAESGSAPSLGSPHSERLFASTCAWATPGGGCSGRGGRAGDLARATPTGGAWEGGCGGSSASGCMRRMKASTGSHSPLPAPSMPWVAQARSRQSSVKRTVACTVRPNW